MSDKIKPDEVVLTGNVTFERVIYKKYTPFASLPDELQKNLKLRAKEKGTVLFGKYADVFKPEKKNDIQLEKQIEYLQRKIATHEETIRDLQKKLKAATRGEDKKDK